MRILWCTVRAVVRARPPVFAAFNLAIDVRVLPDEPLPGLIDLLLMGLQLLHP